MFLIHSYLRPKLHAIFLDDVLNDDWEMVAHNIYQTSIHTAIKAHAYIKEVERSDLGNFPDTKLVHIIHQLAEYLDAKITKRCGHPLICGTGISKTLLLRAFHDTWSKRPYRYRSILPRLEKMALSLRETYGDSLEDKLTYCQELMLGRILF
jgi:hypothetical protein